MTRQGTQESQGTCSFASTHLKEVNVMYLVNSLFLHFHLSISFSIFFSHILHCS